MQNSLAYKFLDDLNVPGWFRGLANFQRKAADQLSYAIRDDIQQNSTHRVSDLLRLIGLSPNISKHEAVTLLKFSGGNELAFLWFAWELIYKTNGNNYSTNEQLLLSMIAHLDMVTTLRELDRILPPRQPSKRDIKNRKELNYKRKNYQRKKKIKCKNNFPYFVPPNLPQEYGKKLTIDIPDFKANFPLYEAYKDPNYIAPNETNRWFENYQFQPGKRIAKGIIQEELNTLFDEHTGSVRKTKSQHLGCEHHKILNELQMSLKRKLKVIAKQECLGHLNVEQIDKEDTQKRINQELERDVEIYLTRFREEAAKSLKFLNRSPNTSNDYIRIRKITSQDEYKVFDQKQSSDIYASNSDIALAIIPGEISEPNLIGDWSSNSKAENQKVFPCVCEGGGDAKNNVGGDLFYILEGEEDIGGANPPDLNEVGINEESKKQNDKCLTSKPSEIFFHAPTENKPFQFEYEKIFKIFDDENTEDDKNALDVKEHFTKNLYIENGLTYERPESRIHADEELNVAIDTCAKKIWEDLVKEKSTEIEQEIIKIRDSPKYYDPNDVKLMLKLLQESFDQLKQNPRFVLASLPEAYKCPLFLTWILERFGKVYTHKERLKLFNNTQKLFIAIDHILDKIPKPKSNIFSKAQWRKSSVCSEYFQKRYKNFVKSYLERLDEVLLEQTRIGWFAMKPELCVGGQPDKPYFAYMPSNSINLLHFHLWRPHEHKSNYQEWLHRNGKLLRSVY